MGLTREEIEAALKAAEVWPPHHGDAWWTVDPGDYFRFPEDPHRFIVSPERAVADMRETKLHASHVLNDIAWAVMEGYRITGSVEQAYIDLLDRDPPEIARRLRDLLDDQESTEQQQQESEDDLGILDDLPDIAGPGPFTAEFDPTENTWLVMFREEPIFEVTWLDPTDERAPAMLRSMIAAANEIEQEFTEIHSRPPGAAEDGEEQNG